MTRPKSTKKKRSRRTEAAQRHRLLERGERMGGPVKARPRAPEPPRAPRGIVSHVATQEYRDGWDRIFGGTERGQA